MKLVAVFVIAFEVLIFLGVISALIYLIIKRIKDKRQETFERRDN